jgi:hypothetical protein
MKNRILSLGMVALALTASSAAYADVHVVVGVNPFGWWVPAPPVVYAPPAYYASPPVVYYGRGQWGDRRDWRGSRSDRGRNEHHDQGDRRHE